MKQEIADQEGRIANAPEVEMAAVNGTANGQIFVVGLGASAGGLEALEAFFDNMRPDSGMAFVIVQHLSPDFKCLMDELLSRHTEIAIHRVEDGMVVEANSIYLIPPKKEMTISGGLLLLTDTDPAEGRSLPIDTFFCSLAQDIGDRAVAIVLSGTGSDGSRGVRAVNEAGGLVIVQDPKTAKFDGMPRSAIDATVVHLVLPPQEIPAYLLRHVRHPLALLDAPPEVVVPPDVMASNAELQSTNEELHSVNEELYSVNAEHQRKIRELTELTDDMNNLICSTEVGTVFLDRELCIRKFTPKFEEIFQILPQDLGRRIVGFAHNLIYDKVFDDLTQVLESEEALEHDVRDRSGRWHWVRILPYRSESGVGGVVMSLIDISRLKQTEQQLRLINNVYLDAADPIIIEDLNGRIIDVNEQTPLVFGWTRGELLGQETGVLVSKEQYREFKRLRNRCRRSEHVRDVEMEYQTKTGKKLPVSLTLSLLSNESSEPVAIAWMAKNITLRKRAEAERARYAAELEATNQRLLETIEQREAAEAHAREETRLREEFLAMLSHELRNPLGALLNATYVLDRQFAEKAIRPAGVIQRQAQQMARLLDDLLDVSRVTQGKIEIRREVLDLTALVEDAVAVVRFVIAACRHELTIDIQDQPLYVEGDSARLLQVMENLLVNAAKYTPPAGHIELTIRRQGEAAEILVRDDGIGIASDMLQRIFELFVQSENTDVGSGGGMGVGLTLVRHLIELQGGTVSVQSDGPNRGSIFSVRLPVTNKRPSTTETEALLESAPAGSMKIVLVEDNVDAREMLASLLELDGYDVMTAADGRQGLDAILRAQPTAAIVDIGLPGLDGLSVAREVRQSTGDHRIYLIALTGYGQHEDRKAVLAAGFDEHLVKPVNPVDLSQSLNRARQARS